MRLDHEFTLNTDGSGKVRLHWEGPKGAAPDDFVRSEISGARGVEAWSGVSCDAEGEFLRFDATAYFPSLKELRFHCQGFHVSVLDFETGKDKKGNFFIRGQAPAGGEKAPAPLKGAALQAKIREAREGIAQMRGFLDEIFGALAWTVVLHLPGKVAKSANCKKQADGSLRQDFSGKAILAVLDRLMKDDALAAKAAQHGMNDPSALQHLLPDAGPISAETTGKLKDLFDYATEAGAAKENFQELVEERQLPPGVKEAPPMKNVRVVAAKVVREADSENELSPQMNSSRGLCLTLAGELPGPALSLKEGKLGTAKADTGEELAPESDWNRTFHFPKLTKDRRTAYFDMDLAPAPEGSAGLKEIRGTLRAVVSEGEEEVDLGFPRLEPGAAGTKAGAVLERIEENGEGRITVEVKLQVSKDVVLGLSLVRAEGASPLTLNGYSASSDECQLTFEGEGTADPAARLVGRFATGLQEYDVPFVLEDVDYLGNPRAAAPAPKLKQVKKKK